MQLIPAIDIRHGRCVRLLRGDFDRETRYEVDPVALASTYRSAGAEWLHIVDLDGAARGAPAHLELLERIAESGLRIQFGGGIRERASLEAALAIAERVVIGSLAVLDPGPVEAWFAEFGPERFTLALDVRVAEDETPYVTTHGWTERSTLTLWGAIERYAGCGLRHVLCTDVEKDGAMQGPNVELYRATVARWPDLALQASGGVRDAGDLDLLAAAGAAGAISGKALLEGRLRLEEVRRFLPNA